MKNGKRIASIGRIVGLCIAASVATSFAGADETVICDRVIKSVPYVITQPGHYCLNGNLTGPTTGGSAIRIAADNVWLDLNNYALDGSAAGLSASVVAIFSEGQKHLTVRNGIIRGYREAIIMGDGTPGAEGLTIEGIRADRNTQRGITMQAAGEGNLIRGNRISNTGGSPFLAGTAGLTVAGDVSVIDNDVVNTFATAAQPNKTAVGIIFDGVDSRAIAINNRVTRATHQGITCNGSAGAEVVLRDNIVLEAATPYLGCTPVGATNYP